MAWKRSPIGNRKATAAEPAPPQPGQQPPQVVPAQPGISQGGSQADRPRPTTGMGGMAGMRGQAAAAAEQVPQRLPSQPAIGPGASQGYPQQPAASMGGMGSTGRSYGPGPDHAGGVVYLVPSGCLAGDDGIARHSGKAVSRSQGIGKRVSSKRADAHQGTGTKNFSRLP